jgi:aminopeptidase N
MFVFCLLFIVSPCFNSQNTKCAHMWFGNLVTMHWWNDLWLNEGFATYAGWQAVKAMEPLWDVPCILFTDEIARALQVDAFIRTHAVEIDPSIDDADEISSLVGKCSVSCCVIV